jgi:large subunit ribosomal protein L6
MSYQIPPYMSIAVDEEARTRTLAIEDAEDRKQRAMWGT